MQSRTGIIVLLLICVAAVSFMAGCTQTSPAAQKPAATPGMANPASVSCVENGGTVEIKKDATGAEYGMCKFANGTSCEEWALFRGEGCKAGVQAAAK